MRRGGIASAAILLIGACGVFGVCGAGVRAYGQSQATHAAEPASQAGVQKQPPSAGRDVGSGAGDIGKGAAKGVGDLAEGTGKGAVDLVTLHPINAAGDLGKGGAKAGKNIVVGTAKGTGKIAKGTGKAIKKIF